MRVSRGDLAMLIGIPALVFAACALLAALAVSLLLGLRLYTATRPPRS